MMKAGLESDDFGTRFCYHYGICIQHNLKVRKIYVPNLHISKNSFRATSVL